MSFSVLGDQYVGLLIHRTQGGSQIASFRGVSRVVLSDLVLVTEFYGNFIVSLFVLFYRDILWSFVYLYRGPPRDRHCKLAEAINDMV